MSDNFTTSGTMELTADGESKIPSSLNVLTILTFIGSGIGLLFALLTPAINNFFLGMMDKARSSGKEFTTKELSDMEKAKAVIELGKANMVPLIAISVVSIALCIAGAVMMRKLKKDGFWVYVAGEVLPIIGGLILMGTAQFTGVFSVILIIGIPLLFVILYTRQRKYLIN